VTASHESGCVGSSPFLLAICSKNLCLFIMSNQWPLGRIFSDEERRTWLGHLTIGEKGEALYLS